MIENGILVSQNEELSLVIAVQVPGVVMVYAFTLLREPDGVAEELFGGIMVYETAPPGMGDVLPLSSVTTAKLLELQPSVKLRWLVRLKVGKPEPAATVNSLQVLQPLTLLTRQCVYVPGPG